MPRDESPLLVFDLDGTLVDSAPDLVGTLNMLLEREHIAPLPFETARLLVGAGARALIVRGFAAAGDMLAPQRLEMLFADFLNLYETRIARDSRLYPGVEAALVSLERAGWRMAVCTNKTEKLAVALIHRMGISKHFAAVCGQDTFAWSKPDGRVLIQTIERAGGTRERAIMVGDSRTDIETARNAGVPVIAVTFGYSDTPITDLGPDITVGHFDDLPEAARRLIDRPAAEATVQPKAMVDAKASAA